MNVLHRKLKRAFEIWNNHGVQSVLNHSKVQFKEFLESRNYQKWIEREKITEEKRIKFRSEIKRFVNQPLISIILPVYNVEEKYLRLCIESVTKQIYENWELCIADDRSPSPHIRRVLEEYSKKDARIKVVFRPENGHISAASNSALELATGEFCVLLDHDDELSEDALFYVAKELNDFPETEMIFSDEDLISEHGKRFAPKFKPDFSRDLFYSLNLITHLSGYKTDVLRKIGGFSLGLEGSQDYDLALRVIEQIPEKHIRHIPKILYHWRVIKGSVAYSGDEKPYAHDAARRAIGAHLERCGKKAKIEPTFYNLHRIRYELPENLPKISLIALADENAEFTRKSIENFVKETDYSNFEIVLICSQKVKNELENSTSFQNLRLISDEKASEAEKYNSAVSQTSGEILCFVDINLRPLAKDWLKEMASFAIQKDIGAVGAKILYKDKTILHGGLLIGINGSVGIAHRRLPGEKGGNMGRLRVIGNYSAVSVSCFVIRRDLFTEFGGFDAENFPNKFFDADICLRIREKNFRNVFTPYAEFTRFDERKLLNVQKNPSKKELKSFRQKWQKFIEKDPFYNPNLSKTNETFLIDI